MYNKPKHIIRQLSLVAPILALLTIVMTGCIENDIPYPKIVQNIRELAAVGEIKEAYIDSIAFEATIYLGEDVDIENVRFDKYVITEDGKSDPNLLEGTYNLTDPLFVTLTRYQDYVWEIKAVQDIERYFVVRGQIGESTIDPVGHRVIVNMPTGTDLSNLILEKVKLGPADITTLTPDLQPGALDLSYPVRVAVECFGRTVYWTIYAELSDLVVNTTQVDPWAMVVWAYGEGPADVAGGFEYRKATDTEWTAVPESSIHQTQGSFSCHIDHLQPLTEYVVRATAGEDKGNEVTVVTSATADIPDGDFENWSQDSNTMWCPWAVGGEQYWGTGNPGSITLRVNLTIPSEHTPPGTSGKSAQLNTQFVGLGALGKLGAGSIYTGAWAGLDKMDGILNFGRPWKLRPTRLRGYYQYQTAEINYASTDYASMKGQPDECHIYVALTDWTAPYEIRTKPSNRQLFDKNADYVIAYGELIENKTMSGFKEFTIELEYRDTSKVPSYLQITCTSSRLGDYFTGGAGAKLWVDQFSFDWDY